MVQDTEVAMSELKVWAPFAARMEVEIDGGRRPLQPAAGGWWTAAGTRLVDGTEYALWLNDEGPFPDPRSPSQPHGVHGPSRHIDHDRFVWNQNSWQPAALTDAIIYELHTGTFTPEGTFASAISRLDQLQELGITHIEIMPVAEFAGLRGWGYDGVDLYAPHHHYGGPEGLKRLVDACHQRNLGVILDVVYNHFGAEGNYAGKFAPYFQMEVKTPWGNAVNLDGPGSAHVRQFFIDNALMWLRDYRFDGLRLDATHAFVDRSQTHFLAQLTSAVKNLGASLGRELVLIAENDLNDPRVVRKVDEEGWGFDAQGNEDFHHALHTLLTGENFGYFMDYGRVSDLATVLCENFCLAERYSTFRQRVHGWSARDIASSHYVAFSQNHDQTGNRAQGERICHLVDSGQLKIAATITLLSPFVPMLFQGEEWAASSPFQYFADLSADEIREAVRVGRREEFSYLACDPGSIPDPLDEATWRKSQLQWDERGAEKHRDIFAWYKALIELRRREPELTASQRNIEDLDYREDPAWISFRRGRFRIVCNFSAGREIIDWAQSEQVALVMASSQDVQLAEKAGSISMPAHSTAILRTIMD